MDRCCLVDPYVVSGSVEERLGIVEMVKVTSEWTRGDLLCFLHPEGEGALDYEIRDKNCDVLCSTEQGAIEGSDNGCGIRC